MRQSQREQEGERGEDEGKSQRKEGESDKSNKRHREKKSSVISRLRVYRKNPVN